MRFSWIAFAAAGALLSLATPAPAHPGHEPAAHGFLAGLVHPLSGVDHLAVMLMVGLWGGLTLPRLRWAPPVAFLIFMLAGFGWGEIGGSLPMTEAMIVASLVALGLVLAFAVRPSIPVATSLAGLFAIAHGHAHGAEMPAHAASLAYAAGFALSTALLLLVGLGAARIANGAGRAAGLAGVGAGALLLVTG